MRLICATTFPSPLYMLGSFLSYFFVKRFHFAFSFYLFVNSCIVSFEHDFITRLSFLSERRPNLTPVSASQLVSSALDDIKTHLEYKREINLTCHLALSTPGCEDLLTYTEGCS